MNRLLALLLLPLLLFARSAEALGAWCVEEAGRCAEMPLTAEAHGCCDPAAACACEASPAREEAPRSPASPAPGSRGADLAVLAAVKLAVAEMEFADARPAVVARRHPVAFAAPVPRTVLHCLFLI